MLMADSKLNDKIRFSETYSILVYCVAKKHFYDNAVLRALGATDRSVTLRVPGSNSLSCEDFEQQG